VACFCVEEQAYSAALMRFLGIDLGDKRTGLAVGDDETALASPLRIVELPLKSGIVLHPALAERLAAAAKEAGAESIVIGLPLNMDGTEGPRAKEMRTLGAAIGTLLALPVEYHDERLTSDAADWAMAGSGLTHRGKKQRRDAVAAALMLQAFLDARRRRSQREDRAES